MSRAPDVEFSEFHAFERGLLYAVRALEREGEPPKGLDVKVYVESEYGDEINHSRLYQNLDALVDRELLTKGKKDDRTNEYKTTETARKILEARTKRRAQQVGLLTEGGVAR